MKALELPMHLRQNELDSIEEKINSISKIYFIIRNFVPSFGRIILTCCHCFLLSSRKREFYFKTGNRNLQQKLHSYREGKDNRPKQRKKETNRKQTPPKPDYSATKTPNHAVIDSLVSITPLLGFDNSITNLKIHFFQSC